MVRIVSLSVLLTLIVILSLTFYKVLAPFALPLFLAAVFSIVCQPVYAYFLNRTGNRVRLASGMTTASVVSVILVPLVVGTLLASLQLFVVATDLSDRNLGQTLQEKTDPILQHVAAFVNSRVRSVAITQPIASSSSDAEIHAGDDESGTEEAGDAGMPLGEAPAAAVEEKGDASTSESQIKGAESPATNSAAELPAQGRVPDKIVVAEAGASSPTIERPPRHASADPLTAEQLRSQIRLWLQDALSEMGRKSLGMAGGTFDFLSGSLLSIGSAVLSFVIFSISLYYFLADGTQLVRATERLIPMHVEYQRQMLDQFSRVVRAVVMATFMAALAQAIATVFALWFLGFHHLLLILVLALLMSMIPMLGTWLVWLPCALYLLYTGQWFQSLLLTVYGAAFVGTLDNVVRTYVLNTDVKLHPLLALISVLGGLKVMGLWGMFVGPIVASCLHALVKIFNHELARLSHEKFSSQDALAKE